MLLKTQVKNKTLEEEIEVIKEMLDKKVEMNSEDFFLFCIGITIKTRIN